MREVVYNLIAYFDEMEIVSFLGIATHELDGSDEQKLRFLSAEVASDTKSQHDFFFRSGTSSEGATVTSWTAITLRSNTSGS